MKKKTVITLVVLAVAVLFALFVFATQGGFENLYFGDRLTGTYSSDVFYGDLSLSLDGIDVHEISCLFSGKNVKVKTDDKNENFAIKGNEYGKYKIYFRLRRGDIYNCTSGQVWLDDDFVFCVSLVKNKNQIEHLNVHANFIEIDGEWYITVKAEDSDGTLTEQKTEKLDASNTEIKLDFGV